MVRDIPRNKVALYNVMLCVAMTVTGGMLDWSVGIIGIMVCALFLCDSIGGAKPSMGLTKDPLLVLSMAFLAVAIVVSFWSIDYSYNLLGVMRIAVLYFWGLLVCQKTNDAREEMIKGIPILGVILVIMSFAAYFVPFLNSYFWKANRLSGTFQYANTAGIFLLLCLVICAENMANENNVKTGEGTLSERLKRIAVLALLVVGLLMTGSRSAFILAIIWAVYEALVNRKQRTKVIGIMLLVLLAGATSFFMFDKTQWAGRLFTFFRVESSGTVFERAAYYRDAFSIIVRHPMGLGFHGYEYILPLFKSQSYATIFVHNDLLQICLDYGVAAMIIVACIFGLIFMRSQHKVPLAILCLGCMSDFHFQYLFIGMVAVLIAGDSFTLEREAAHDEKGMKHIALPGWVFIAFAVVFTYLSIAFLADSVFSNYDVALSLLPGYTQAQENRLKMMDDFEIVDNLSNSLIKKNKYNSQAFTARSVVCELTQDYEKMAEAMDKSLELSGWEVGLCEEYEYTINNCLKENLPDNERRILSNELEVIKAKKNQHKK